MCVPAATRVAGGELRPVAHVAEAVVALDAIHAGEALGELAMVRAQDVDAEEASLADVIVGARRLVDAHQDLGGSADTEQTAVAVNPPRRSRRCE